MMLAKSDYEEPKLTESFHVIEEFCQVRTISKLTIYLLFLRPVAETKASHDLVSKGNAKARGKQTKTISYPMNSGKISV